MFRRGKTPAHEYVREHKKDVIAKVAGLYLFEDRIVRLSSLFNYGTDNDIQPVAGAIARVDTAGGIAARATLARSAVPGMHGWQQKIDTRELWIVIDGPTFQWQVQVLRTNDAHKARKFAEKVNTVSRLAAEDQD